MLAEYWAYHYHEHPAQTEDEDEDFNLDEVLGDIEQEAGEHEHPEAVDDWEVVPLD